MPTLLRDKLTVVYSGYGFNNWVRVIVGSPSVEDAGTIPKNGLGTRSRRRGRRHRRDHTRAVGEGGDRSSLDGVCEAGAVGCVARSGCRDGDRFANRLRLVLRLGCLLRVRETRRRHQDQRR